MVDEQQLKQSSGSVSSSEACGGSYFERALAQVLAHEGGFVDDPADSGGATNWGISLRLLRELPQGDLDGNGKIDSQDIRCLTREQAGEFYRIHWWERYGYQDFPEAIGIKVFDLAVNMGPRPAHRLLQRAVRACGEQVVEDGILGPQSRQACARVTSITTEVLLAALRSEAAGYYRALCIQHPHLSRFRRGWLRRAYA